MGLVVDQVTVKRELADDGVDLPQRELGAAFQPAADEAIGVLADADLQGGGTAVAGERRAVLAGQTEDALNAANRDHALLAVHELAERADVAGGLLPARPQL